MTYLLTHSFWVSTTIAHTILQNDKLLHYNRGRRQGMTFRTCRNGNTKTWPMLKFNLWAVDSLTERLIFIWKETNVCRDLMCSSRYILRNPVDRTGFVQYTWLFHEYSYDKWQICPTLKQLKPPSCPWGTWTWLGQGLIKESQSIKCRRTSIDFGNLGQVVEKT